MAYFLWTGSGLSMIFLVRTVCNREKCSIWGGYSALLYLFNTFIMFKPADENFRLVHMALPLMLALYIRGVRSKQTTLYAVWMGFASLIFASSSVNPPAVSIIWITLFIYFCSDLFLSRRLPAISDLYFPIKIIVIYILFNAWWMFVTLPGMINVSSGFSSVMGFTSLTTEIVEVLRFMGSWAFRATHQGVYYFSYWEYYYGGLWFVTFCSYLILIIAISGYIVSPSYEEKNIQNFILIMVSLMVISIFLIKGISPPIGDLYRLIWNNVPGFWVFREPFTKFTPLLIFAVSVLFGYAVSTFNNKIHIAIRYKIFGNIMLVSIVFAATYPLFSQEVFRRDSVKDFKSRYIQFPKYWMRLGSWLKNNDQTGKIFILPRPDYGVAYNWENGASFAGPVTTLMLPNPTLGYRPETTYGEKKVNLLYKYLDENNSKLLLKNTQLLGIKYFLFQDDVESANLNMSIIYEKIKNQEWLSLYKKFGNLYLFKVNNSHFHHAVNITN